eukprot:TRINITY_DN19318_c0_g1_i1.p1 TRINITY_DN19318_c0_g1~~TRINITY_DN19318_c0_g1_i1.p1  ORF type:complete len:868 (+),score=152.11 TRINITY_DN19318_c0_g1_i1:72-2606(+)
MAPAEVSEVERNSRALVAAVSICKADVEINSGMPNGTGNTLVSKGIADGLGCQKIQDCAGHHNALVRSSTPPPASAGYRTPSEPATPSMNQVCEYMSHFGGPETGTDALMCIEHWDWKADAPEFIPEGMVCMMGASPEAVFACPMLQAMPQTRGDELHEMQIRINQLQMETAQARNAIEMEKRKLVRQIGSYRAVLEQYCIPPDEASTVSYPEESESQKDYAACYEQGPSSQWHCQDGVQLDSCQLSGGAELTALVGGPLAAGQFRNSSDDDQHPGAAIAALIGGGPLAAGQVCNDDETDLDSKMRQLNTLLKGSQSSGQQNSSLHECANGEEGTNESARHGCDANNSNGPGYSSGAIASTLQAMFPHARIRTGIGKQEANGGNSNDADEQVTDAEEVDMFMKSLERTVGSKVDERALMSLQSLPYCDAKEALQRVEELVQSQGGQCRNLSSILQSVCRKLAKKTKQVRSEDMPNPLKGFLSSARSASTGGTVGFAVERRDESKLHHGFGASKASNQWPMRAGSLQSERSPTNRSGAPNPDTPSGKRSWADIGDFEDEADEEAPLKNTISEPEVVQPPPRGQLKSVAENGLELRMDDGNESMLKIDMANLDPPLDEPGWEKYCNWLHERLAAFRGEHGSACLRRCNGEVDFSQNNMTDQMVWMLFETLAQHEVHTAVVKLNGNCISQGGILALGEYIRTNEAEAVRELHLSNNEIDDESALELLRTLQMKPGYPPKRACEETGKMKATPVWVMLSHNRIEHPEQVCRMAKAEGITMCSPSDKEACDPKTCQHDDDACPTVHLHSFNVQAQGPSQTSASDKKQSDGEGTEFRGQRRKNKKRDKEI